MTHKAFHVTVDFPMYLLQLDRPAEPKEIRELMAYFHEIGIERVYWMRYDPSLILRPISTGESDLTLACRFAHEFGMECYALIKPFETGVTSSAMPPTWGVVRPEDSVSGVMGLYQRVTDFVCAHRELRIQHRSARVPHDALPIGCIKLLKEDDSPTRITGQDLKLYTSGYNGDFRPYRDFGCVERVETREGKAVRLLVIEGIEIPPEKTHIAIICSRHDETPTFKNRADRMVELYDSNGDLVVSTWNDHGPCSRAGMERMAWINRMWRYGVYGDRSIPGDYGRDLPTSSFFFDQGHRYLDRALDGPDKGVRLSKTGYELPSPCTSGHIVVARGRNPYLIGALHPCYPEVRGYWLEMVRGAVGAGVDGVDFRVANHSSWCGNGLEYGFNPPVVAEYRRRYGVDVLTENFDVDLWKKLQGEYYTQFLREAREALRSSGKKMQIHVNGAFELPRMQHPGCIGGANNIPVNFEFPWAEWMREGLADSVMLKDIRGGTVDEHEGNQFGERVCELAGELAIPVYVEGWICGADGHAYWDECVAFIRRWREKSGVAGTVLYEGASFTEFDSSSGRMEGSDPVRRLIASI